MGPLNSCEFSYDLAAGTIGDNMARILIVDDEPSISWGLSRLARSMGHEVDVAPSAEEGLCLAAANRAELLILDVRLPGMDGLSAMESFSKALDGAPIIIITAFGDLATALGAVRKGAFEYVVKPFDLAAIRAVIERALRKETAPQSAASPDALHGMLGRAPVMQNVFKRVAIAASSDAAVLLRGENGTGKELAASVIHRNSSRRALPLVMLDVAAIDPANLEREVVGETGSATGRSRAGLFVQAHGGTLFIDEVADLPMPVQLKLLRTLERGEVTPIGGEVPLRSRFRVISATRHNLAQRVSAGEFRHDLYLRLCTFEIALPPLRERVEDIELLAHHFAAQANGQPVMFAAETLVELMQRPWHGNVRELRGAIEHALVVARRGALMPEHLPPVLPDLWQAARQEREAVPSDVSDTLLQIAQQLVSDPATAGEVYDRFLQQVEPPLLATVMNKCGQRCAPAARVLGLHRTTLKKKLTQYEIEEVGGEN